MKNRKQNFLTPHQVADLLRVSPVTVRHWALDGKLNFVTTPGGHRRFSHDDIVQFARQHNMSLPHHETGNLRVLVVDDNRDLSDYLVELLSGQACGISVDVAYDGFEAGEKLHVFKPDVVLLDLMMPGLDGFETCRRIKQNKATQQVRVLAMTGYPSQENIQNIKAAGAELCLPKPVVVADLMEALGNISSSGAKK